MGRLKALSLRSSWLCISMCALARFAHELSALGFLNWFCIFSYMFNLGNKISQFACNSRQLQFSLFFHLSPLGLFTFSSHRENFPSHWEARFLTRYQHQVNSIQSLQEDQKLQSRSYQTWITNWPLQSRSLLSLASSHLPALDQHLAASVTKHTVLGQHRTALDYLPVRFSHEALRLWPGYWTLQ
jgi:hypothetical protein